MFSRIESLPPTLIVGMSKHIKLTPSEITALWKAFMPRLKEISNRKGSDIFSVQIYDQGISLENFNPDTLVIKWAAVPVNDFSNIHPEGMQQHLINGGLYAVFIHKGLPAAFPATMNYIFKEWLPNSEYAFDNREQFEIMGDKYRNNDPISEEEVWIPVKK